VPASFQTEGDLIVSLAQTAGPIGGHIATRVFGSSEYARALFGKLWGGPPMIDFADEKALHECLAALSAKGLIHSASDLSDGGYAVGLAEASFANGIGCEVALQAVPDTPLSITLFGEFAHHVLITCAESDLPEVQKIADEFGFTFPQVIGKTRGKSITIRAGGDVLIDAKVDELKSIWSKALQSTLSIDTVTA
jgi:phosphoribosylformylglycinamidine synthase